MRSPSVSDTRRDAVLTRSLRYEIAGDEGRALLGSYTFAFALGIAWLLIVYFGPKTLPMQLLARDEQPIAVTFDALEPLPGGGAPGEEGEAIRTPAPSRNAGAGSRPTTARAGAIAAAFGSANGTGTGGMVGDVSNVLRNVDVSSGAGGTGAGDAATGGGATGGKVVLGSGEGGQGSRTPGRGNIGGTTGIGGAAGGIGGVGPGGGTVSRAPVRISPPRPIDAPAVRGVQRDVGELGTFVRGRESQLALLLQRVRAEGESVARRFGVGVDRPDARGRRERRRHHESDVVGRGRERDGTLHCREDPRLALPGIRGGRRHLRVLVQLHALGADPNAGRATAARRVSLQR